ncbi:MAG: DUF302 domain-containing protein [Campylobacteraceae bacterium]|jgi:uncharacterized protein (DUF302 family)|nr:DUF302 domain-containing protein [Campylobacteraceae bacterium]MBT3883093.1 DUF302 domain-containing protein [Campylobacteraceae bacterium]MBT4030178.1 DUF302 domain-containing protein [Campylobacteraceae bacterium]MBT4178750.1 DUF302 domain-containing protein [Campylobacteraceae bacterium]MBT4572724.1 DUF302 domain-containing protein [Campylobacteraceae bacterium]
MKNIILTITLLFVATTLSAKGDLHLFDVNNKDKKITTKTIEQAFIDSGFTIGINQNMNTPFKKQFKQTDFQVFTLMTMYHTKLSIDLVNKHADAGVFTPMGVGIYQKLNDDTLHVSILTSAAHEKILGISNSPILKQIETEVLAVLKKALPNANYKISKDPLGESRELLTKYELTLEEDDDAEEIIEELQMTLESAFKPKGFVVPKKLSFDMDLNPDDADDSIYESFTNYSICKLEVIYTVAKTRPDAAAFAPCTTMIYKKRGENKIVLGFPSVYNWMSSALVGDKESLDALMKAQKDFESILQEVTE